MKEIVLKLVFENLADNLPYLAHLYLQFQVHYHPRLNGTGGKLLKHSQAIENFLRRLNRGMSEVEMLQALDQEILRTRRDFWSAKTFGDY